MSSALPLLGDLEGKFFWPRARQWLGEEYRLISVCVCSLYLALVFTGRRWMKERPPLSLRTTLAMWNTGLAVFSISGCFTLVPSFFRNLRAVGFSHTVCNNWVHTSDNQPPVELWCLLFILSKPVELGDTSFIVLRKTPLNFLHWYHHVTVLLYAAWFGEESPALSTCFAVINYFVHSIMYSYYTLRAAGVYVPRSVARVITLLQLAQFVMCMAAIFAALLQKASGVHCDASYTFLYSGLFMFISYFVLFLNFFCQRYVLVRK